MPVSIIAHARAASPADVANYEALIGAKLTQDHPVGHDHDRRCQRRRGAASHRHRQPWEGLLLGAGPDADGRRLTRRGYENVGLIAPDFEQAILSFDAVELRKAR